MLVVTCNKRRLPKGRPCFVNGLKIVLGLFSNTIQGVSTSPLYYSQDAACTPVLTLSFVSKRLQGLVSLSIQMRTNHHRRRAGRVRLYPTSELFRIPRYPYFRLNISPEKVSPCCRLSGSPKSLLATISYHPR